MAKPNPLLEKLRVKPGASPRLDRRDPDLRFGAAGKREGIALLQERVERLAVLHNRLSAEASRALLWPRSILPVPPPISASRPAT